MPRRPATGMAMMDDHYTNCGNDGGGGDDDNDNRNRAQWHNHPSSADIVEYDSSVAADTPSAQQHQPTQFVPPHHQQQQQQQQQQRQRQRVDQPSQRPANDANCAGAKTTTARTAAGPKSKTTWKTGALYVFLACLLAVVVVNLSLTLWFIRVTRFTSEGMGSMKFTHGGLRLSGRTLVTDRLVASAIRSRLGQPIRVESTANITLTARNSQGRLVNSLKLTKDGLECAQANVFRVTDTRGETLFSADRSKVIVGAHELRVTGSGGAVFQGSVQTPVVRADSRHDLRLESASRRLELSGPQGVTIESRAGDITVSCLMDVKLESIAGAIQIDAAKVFFKGLKTVGMSSASSSAGQQNAAGRTAGDGTRKRGVDDKLPSVYQLCVCGNGKVFMSPPDGQCAADNESLVCR